MGVLLLSLNTSKMKVDRTPKSLMSNVAVTDKDINKILPVSLKYAPYSW